MECVTPGRSIEVLGQTPEAEDLSTSGVSRGGILTLGKPQELIAVPVTLMCRDTMAIHEVVKMIN